MAAKKPVVDPNQALIEKYTAAGLSDVKNTYVKKVGSKQVFDTAAADKAVFEIPKIQVPKSDPSNFSQAVSNYSNALSSIQNIGADKINQKDYSSLGQLAKTLRNFDSKDLGENAKQIIANSTKAIDAIDEIRNQKDLVAKEESRIMKAPGGPQRQSQREKSNIEQNKLDRLIASANQNTPKYVESFSRFGLSDLVSGIPATAASAKSVSTGLEALRGDNMFQTGGLAGRLNVQVTDDQILNDINTARKAQAKGLYDIGTAAVTDLQSQLTQANQFLADLPAGDKRRVDTQKTVESISSQLATAQKDTLEAQKLYEGGQPISGTQATDAISKFRESLKLPEERTLAQIESIDPTIGATVRGLSKQYQAMAETPLGATTTAQTEDLRNTIEQEAINQLRLGSTIGAEERRGYEQSIRGAQTARGNIFGLGPAVQEAANIGAAGEQRKLARYGAATAFLGSGETTGAAMARDLGLRNALEQSRLGAAQGFIAGGPTMYNLASQRLGQQESMLNNYLAASQPQQTGGFQAASSAANPYGYVNPNAGFMGAQNAASIYNTLADYQASTYGAKVGAEASMYRSPFQNFASAAGGASSIFGAAFPKGF